MLSGQVPEHLLRAGRPADLTETVEPGDQVLSATRRHLVRLYSLSLGLGLASEQSSRASHGQGKQSHSQLPDHSSSIGLAARE